jgi:hypothetical protein
VVTVPESTSARQGTRPTQGLAGPGVNGDDADPTLADLDQVYLDGTLVLVADSPEQRDPADPVDIHEASVPPGEPVRDTAASPVGPAWEAQDLYTSTGRHPSYRLNLVLHSAVCYATAACTSWSVPAGS